MNSKIGDTNDFPDLPALRRLARDPRVHEIEGGGLDDGRVFIHLVAGFVFDGYDSPSKSVGSAEDIKNVMGLVKRR